MYFIPRPFRTSCKETDSSFLNVLYKPPYIGQASFCVYIRCENMVIWILHLKYLIWFEPIMSAN